MHLILFSDVQHVRVIDQKSSTRNHIIHIEMKFLCLFKPMCLMYYEMMKVAFRLVEVAMPYGLTKKLRIFQ